MLLLSISLEKNFKKSVNYCITSSLNMCRMKMVIIALNNALETNYFKFAFHLPSLLCFNKVSHKLKIRWDS